MGLWAYRSVVVAVAAVHLVAVVVRSLLLYYNFYCIFV